jgi:4-aminobutyrate aminotransferase-like enzyme
MRYLHESVIELAERLVASMPEGSGLDSVMFVNSGSEANDLAWRLAREATGNSGGLVSEFAYHGISSVIADLSPEEWRLGSPDHVETFPAPGLGDGDGDGAEGLCAAVERLAARGIAPAAVYVDGAFTSDGIRPPSSAYLGEIVAAVHEAGGLYVADEVQVGHGRTGGHLWSFADSGIVPDIVTLGKPMGNGYPVAAMIARGELVDRLAGATGFFSTFGGNPPAAAAGLAVLDVIRDEGIVARAKSTGAELRGAIGELVDAHPAIGEVRGWGLLVGVELRRPGTGEPAGELAEAVINGMRDRGVLVGVTGREGNVLKIRPPLAFGTRHLDPLLGTLDEALGAATG